MFATLTIAGSSGAATQTACGRSARAIRWRDDLLLLAVLLRAHQLLAEVVVDRRVGGAAGRAGERDGRGAQALAAHEQLRRRGDERGVAAARAEHVAGLESGAQDAEDRCRVVVGRRVHRDLAGEHDLPEVAGADPLDGARDGGLEVLGWRDRGDPEAPGRRRVHQRQRGVAQLGGALLEPRRQLLGHVVGRRDRGEREPHVGAAARERRPPARSGRRRRSPPSAAPRRRRRRTRSRRPPRARRPAGRPARRPPPRRRARATPSRRRRSAAGRSPRCAWTQPSAASAAPGAVGLLEAEPRLPRPPRRERDRARVDGRRDRHGDRDQHLAAAAPRAADRPLAARAQLGDRGRLEERAHSDPANVTSPVRQLASPRTVTDSVPLTPSGVKRPSTFTR